MVWAKIQEKCYQTIGILDQNRDLSTTKPHFFPQKITYDVETGFNLICTYILHSQGPFTNYVDKKRMVVSPKMSNFVNFYRVENVNVGAQVVKKDLVNVVCERPLTMVRLWVNLQLFFLVKYTSVFTSHSLFWSSLKVKYYHVVGW